MRLTPQIRKPSGFTVVELLVAIAIVAVLATITFSVSSKMTQSAKASRSATHLKQISPVLEIIRQEGVDTGQTPAQCFPPYAGQISTPGKWREFTLYELLGEEAGFCRFENGRYRWSSHPAETFLQNPLSKHRLAGSAKSPSDVGKDNLRPGWGGYGYNALIEGWVSVKTSDAKKTRPNKIRHPERIIIMAEQNPNHGGAPIWMGPWPNVTPAGTYKASAFCLFVDGHVEHLKNDYLSSTEGKQRHFYP